MSSVHPIQNSLSFAQYAIVQQLNDKADDTQTPAYQKEIESRLHVIQVEAVISIERVNDSYLPGKYFNRVHAQGNPEVVQTCFNHMINNFSNSLHQWVSMIHNHYKTRC
jgi:hypothetical protein